MEFILKENGSERVKMSELKIFNQPTGNLIQTIDFESSKFAMGNVSTIIYTNVQYTEDGFFIWKDVGMMGKEIYYDWNSVAGKYELQSNK
ncbi:hypothetical protein [Rhodohalobacter sp.]|uniref:hypothetical protein n=1 Tax=Rhodohalobacter sp. TaxID=1974210 RepID=UPI002ACE7C5E|nr:hypothetical protein [Rhodohalobacter sp.]MDZ7754850.1 hypothetical protein [Rhodohalobacter sp.]